MGGLPPELVWLSGLATFAALLFYSANLIVHWRNRRHIEFRSISATVYPEVWDSSELVATKARGQGLFYDMIKPGDWKRAFTVLEFTITNHYPVEITVGPFMINGWMFAEKYTRGMYHPDRDYRVFDYFTRQPSRLDMHAKVLAKGTLGLRVEILEVGSGGVTHRHPTVPVPKRYLVEFQSSVGKHRGAMRLGEPLVFSSGTDFAGVYRWSEFLGPARPRSLGGPIPQSVELVQRKFTVRSCIATYFSSRRYYASDWLKQIRKRVMGVIPGRSAVAKAAKGNGVSAFKGILVKRMKRSPSEHDTSDRNG